jgi:hypothetical protein
LHPGQVQLDRVLWFELLGFGICTLFFLIAESTNGTYMLQQLAMMAFYIILNLSFILLHNALGKKETFQGSDKHRGMTLKPFVVFSILLGALWFTTLIMVSLNAADYSYW